MIKKVIYVFLALVIVALVALGVFTFKKHNETVTPAISNPPSTATVPTSTTVSGISFNTPAGGEKIRLDNVYLIKWGAPASVTENYFLFDSVWQSGSWHTSPSKGKLGKVNLGGGQYVWQLGLNYNLGMHKLTLANTSDISSLQKATKYESNVFCVESEKDLYNSLCGKALKDFQVQNIKNVLDKQPEFDFGTKDSSGLTQSHIDEFSGVIKGWAYDANQYMKIVIVIVNADDASDTFTYTIDTHVNQTSEYVLTARPDIAEYLKKQGSKDTTNLANFLITSSQFTHPGKWKIQSATFNDKSFAIPAEAAVIYNQQ
jgi:hypothetical protein